MQLPELEVVASISAFGANAIVFSDLSSTLFANTADPVTEEFDLATQKSLSNRTAFDATGVTALSSGFAEK